MSFEKEKRGRMREFDKKLLKNLYKPADNSSGEDNGQITIIGGSKLFHGAPLFSLKVASRIVDMVFFTSPDPSTGRVAERLKSKLLSFIWIPWEDIDKYVEKSDAVLIGPGFMRFGRERRPHFARASRGRQVSFDETGSLTRSITEKLLKKFPDKKWVIDAGSLQTMDADWIPKNAILTPNRKEFGILFGNIMPQDAAKKYYCVIVLKGIETIVCSPNQSVVVKGGNAGLTKGGTGDVQAGLTVALLAKNDPFLAASGAAYIIKAAADDLYKKVGTNYNADDLADAVPLFFPHKMR